MPEDDSGQLRPTRRTYLDIPVGWEAMPEAEKDDVLDGFITLLVEEQGLEVIED